MGGNGKEQIPLRENFWAPASGENGPRLIGSRCTSCGEIYFPRKPKGWCPHCQQQTLTDTLLGTRGKLAAVTLVRQQPAGGFYHGPVPYAYGFVDLEDGVRLVSQIYAEELESLKAGQEVELLIRPLHHNAEDREVLTFMFTPVS